jgi:hypothetical protein
LVAVGASFVLTKNNMSYFVASLDIHGTQRFHLHTSGSVASSDNAGSPKFAYGLSTVKRAYIRIGKEIGNTTTTVARTIAYFLTEMAL